MAQPNPEPISQGAKHLTLAKDEAWLKITLLLPQSVPVGTLSYYKQRNDDFLRRHPDLQAPDYYLNYGDKYASRFMNTLRPQLTEPGQKWVEKVFVLLQQKMEDKLATNPLAFDQLERSPKKFRSFAYSTHWAAYVDAGIGWLPYSDIEKIATTPDLVDIFCWGGIVQMTKTSPWVIWDLLVPSAY